MKPRIYFLDNLRTFLIFLVVLLHSGIVYESILENTWIVVDPVKNNAIGLIRMYLDVFVMFTLFFISGYFVRGSAMNKTSFEFIKSKFNRILLPWIVAVMTMIPAYKAIFLYSRGMPQEEWYSYFHIFQRSGGDPFFFSDNPVQNWLWFLPVLFLFQIIFLFLSKVDFPSIRISIKGWIILTVVAGLIYSMSISTLDLTGWYHSAILHFQRERLFVYFMIFLLGALCNKHRVFDSSTKDKRFYIWTNVVLTIAVGIFTIVALNLFFNLVDPARNYFFVSAPVDRSVYYFTLLISMLSFLYIMIYVFRFSVNKTNNLWKQLGQNSYFVYIIHVVVLGLIALPLLHIPIPAFAKFILLAILTFVASNGLVYAYRKTIQKPLSNYFVTTGTLVIAATLTFTIYARQANQKTTHEISVGYQTPQTVPDMGLHEAAVQGNLEVVHRHIEAGADIDIKEPTGGSSPLITAALFGQTEVAKALIDAGANVNFINNDGSTALHTAAFFCRKEIVELLLENGVDKSIKNRAGSTALASITISFEQVSGIYDYYAKTFGPLGLKLNNSHLKDMRPEIAEMLQ